MNCYLRLICNIDPRIVWHVTLCHCSLPPVLHPWVKEIEIFKLFFCSNQHEKRFVRQQQELSKHSGQSPHSGTLNRYLCGKVKWSVHHRVLSCNLFSFFYFFGSVYSFVDILFQSSVSVLTAKLNLSAPARWQH